MDDRRKDDAITSFSGWWRSWPLLASGGHGPGERPSAAPDPDESADFAIWAAELAAPGSAAT